MQLARHIEAITEGDHKRPGGWNLAKVSAPANFVSSFAYFQDFSSKVYLIPAVFFAAVGAVFLPVGFLAVPFLVLWAFGRKFNFDRYYFKKRTVTRQDREAFADLARGKNGFRAVLNDFEGYWWTGLVELAILHDTLSERIAEKHESSSVEKLEACRIAIEQLYFDMVAKTLKFAPYFDSATDERARGILEGEFLEFYESVSSAKQAAADADLISLATDVASEVPPTLGEQRTNAVAEELAGTVEQILNSDLFKRGNALTAGSGPIVLAPEEDVEEVDA